MLLAALLASSAAPALADAGADLGLSLNPIVNGYHESFNDIIHLPMIPVPLIEGDAHLDNVELTAYGLPPTVAIPYQDAIQGQTALRLTLLDATLRVWEPSHHLAIGAGEMVYNQTTHYASADGGNLSGTGGERQYSRIAGAHYELAGRIPLFAGSLEASLRYAPVLYGTQVTTYDDNSPSRFDPEKAEQIDGMLRYTRPAGRHGTLAIGVRYVNFTAAYNVPGHPLSDRNAALLPSVGYFWHL